MERMYYIGHTNDSTDRYKASSGGIGTAITRYLFSMPEFGTSVTFEFCQEKCMYVPKLIYSAEEINVCGSIYQDIDLVKFVRENICNIKEGVVITCAPCQVTAIRQILSQKNIRSFILSYCCSGQTTIEGTWKYYEFLGIKKDDVMNIQYRGNGWPSGIQIQLKDGGKVFKDNYTEPWVTLHKSQLYQPVRCFYCKRDTGRNADIAIADPWLDRIKKVDNIGSTLFLINSQNGRDVINNMSSLGLIKYDRSSYDEYAVAQKPNVQKELLLKNRRTYIGRFLKLRNNNLYYKWATSSFSAMKKHVEFSQYLLKLSTRRNITVNMRNRINGIIGKIRFFVVKNRLGSYKLPFNIMNGVIIENPQCLYIGEIGGIGNNTYLGPITEYAGIPYNPKIIIGDGTWIGKNCSIAAINKVEIGKNVLFAGHVHITDHSHGFEDVSKPMACQPLTSKGPVIIEDDCWLGFSSEILSGVHIGKHCVVAARAVVTKDVPPYSIVAGNPAKVVKQYNFETKEWERVK